MNQGAAIARNRTGPEINLILAINDQSRFSNMYSPTVPSGRMIPIRPLLRTASAQAAQKT